VFEYEAVVCVNSDHVRELCDAAESLAADHDPAQALIEWLRLVGARATVSSGLAAMAAGEDGGTPGQPPVLPRDDRRGRGALLKRAIGAGAVRPDVDIHDLLVLVNALARAGGGHGHASADQNGLLMLALTGIVTRRPAD
jgi:hypothetical protein